MQRRWPRPATLVAGTLVGLGAAAVVGRVVFERQLTNEIDTLLADARPAAPASVSVADLERLPEPVRRWLHHSRVVGRDRPATVRLRQEGEFQIDGRGWLPFKAEQHFITDPPGFVWKASFRMAPLVSVVGRDRYRGGEGSIRMRVLGLVPVANKSGGGLDQGDLLRYLGELQWFPAGALADYIRWEQLDVDSARATMSYGGITASMTFHFDGDGRLLEERAVRYNDARDRTELWVNRNDSDGEFGGVRVPAAGEGRWEYDSGPYPYIRWRVTDVWSGAEIMGAAATPPARGNRRPLLGLRRKPGRLALALFRMPLNAYRNDAGGLLGHTFLQLTHVGRKTGRAYDAVAMVLRYDEATREAVICAGWGPDTDWVRNLRAGKAAKVQIGRESFTPEHRFLIDDEAFDVVVGFRREHPRRVRLISTILGWGDLRDDNAVRQFIRTHPFIALRPAASPADGQTPGETG